MAWKHDETPEPALRSSAICVQDATLCVDDKGSRRWQYLSVCFSELSDASHEECLEIWGPIAIARARKALDELEAQLPTTPATSNAQMQ